MHLIRTCIIIIVNECLWNLTDEWTTACWPTKLFCIKVHKKHYWVQKLCFFHSIIVEHYSGFTTVEPIWSYILFYSFLHFTSLFIYRCLGKMRPLLIQECSLVLLLCYFTKRELCEYCTIHFNTTNHNAKTRPFDRLKSFSSFFWEVHKGMWPDLTAEWNSHFGSELISSWGVQGAQLTFDW